jgi:hypothetical protein
MKNKSYTEIAVGDRFTVVGMSPVGKPNEDGERQPPRVPNGAVVEAVETGPDYVKVKVVSGGPADKEITFAHHTGLNHLKEGGGRSAEGGAATAERPQQPPVRLPPQQQQGQQEPPPWPPRATTTTAAFPQQQQRQQEPPPPPPTGDDQGELVGRPRAAQSAGTESAAEE